MTWRMNSRALLQRLAGQIQCLLCLALLVMRSQSLAVATDDDEEYHRQCFIACRVVVQEYPLSIDYEEYTFQVTAPRIALA